MGEENKEEKKEEDKKNGGGGNEEKKEEEKKEEEPQEIVLKVDMHCEACARKVARALRGFQGVEDVRADCKAGKVVVKGKTADPIKVCERIQKKSGRKAELISPLPKPPEENKDQEPKEEKKAEEEKEPPPPVVTVVLKVGMHCEACAQVLQKRIRKFPGVESAIADLANDQVIVKGVVDPTKLVNEVYKRTKKQASIVKDTEEKKEEKEEDKKAVEGEKKEEKGGEKKDGDGGGEKGSEDDNKSTSSDMIKKSEYWPPMYYTEYANAAQIFSDDNPHACCVM